jgi:hypothetical protein
LWREASFFLRTNTALKALHMNFDVTESQLPLFGWKFRHVGVNESLETLSMVGENAIFKDYTGFVAADPTKYNAEESPSAPVACQGFMCEDKEFKALFDPRLRAGNNSGTRPR